MSHADDSTSESQWHKLARVRSSGWHYLYVAISVATTLAVWGGIFLPFYALRESLVPPDAFLSGGTALGTIFLWLPPMVPALATSMILGRSIVRRIPAARTALEPELGDDTKTVSSLKKYAKWGRLALIGVLPLCFFGAMSSWATTPARIEVRPIFSATVHSYDWSRVREIETGCTEGSRSGANYHFVLNLTDGTRINLIGYDPWMFAAAYPKIQVALEGRTYGFITDAFAGAPCSFPRPGMQRFLNQPPTDRRSTPAL
jgi:hypothetical protein